MARVTPSSWQFLRDEWLLCAVLSFLEDGGDDLHYLYLLALDQDIMDLQQRLEQHFLLSVDHARHLAMAQSLWSVLCKLSHTAQYTKGQYLTTDEVDCIEDELTRLGVPSHPDRRQALLTAVGRHHKTGSSRFLTCPHCGRGHSHSCAAQLHRCTAPSSNEQPHFCKAYSPFVMYTTAKRGHLESIVWLHYVVCYDQEMALSAAAYNGHVDVVNWLLDHPHSSITVDHRYRDDEELGVNAWRVSPYSQYYTMTKKWGVEQSLSEYIPECRAAKHGDVEGLRRLFAHQLFHERFKFQRVAMSAASAGHLDVLQFLYDHCPDVFDDNLAMYLVEKGQLETLQWLVAHNCISIDDRAIQIAVIYGQTDILKWMLTTISDPSTVRATIEREAQNNTSLPMLQYLVQDHNVRVTTTHATAAITRKDTERVKWILRQIATRGPLTKGKLLLETVIKTDNLELVQYLIEELGFWTPKAFRLASVGKTAAMLEYIHQQVRNRPVEEAQAMLVPMRRNRIDVYGLEAVNWLLDHGFCYGLFDIRTMDAVFAIERTCTAALRKFGHYTSYHPTIRHRCRTLIGRMIEVYDPTFIRNVLWLPKWAASYGKLDALKRLIAIGHVNVLTRRTFHRVLLQNGSERVVQWFLEQRPEFFTTIVVRWAVTHGKRGLLEWVFGSFLPEHAEKELLLRKSVRTALWTAMRYKRTDVIEILPQWTAKAKDRSMWNGISVDQSTAE